MCVVSLLVWEIYVAYKPLLVTDLPNNKERKVLK